MVIWEMSDKESGGDASFEEELSAFAIFEDVGANITFENANII